MSDISHIMFAYIHVHVHAHAYVRTYVDAAGVFHVRMQVPAGLFIPAMFVGACMGRILGIAVEQFV